MNPALEAELQQELHALHEIHRRRACPPVEGPNRARPRLEGRPVVSFCSNDYLGLAGHPALAEAAQRQARDAGWGSGASRLVSGEHAVHRDLEAALAGLTGLPAALVFPTGYHANTGLLPALAGPRDLVVSDAANHASLIDGCRLSRASVAIYPHGDLRAAREALAQPGAFRRRLLLTESLFSMDGDAAPLSDLAEIASRGDGCLVVDEAHALGVLGPAGGGLCRAAGVVPDALVGTLGKAFGALGGFVAGSAALRDVLVNRARTFLFTTAPPPPLAAAALAGVTLSRGPEGEAARVTLQARRSQLAAELPGLPSTPGAIVPVILGTDQAALRAAASLRDHGLFVQPIRPPTVPEGAARLRVTLSAAHTPADVAQLAAALRALL